MFSASENLAISVYPDCCSNEATRNSTAAFELLSGMPVICCSCKTVTSSEISNLRKLQFPLIRTSLLVEIECELELM
jgi:hypothetical protein